MRKNFKEINEKTCQNCRYYSQHYSKQGTRYGKVLCGHCLSGENQNRRKNKPLALCEFWDDIAIKKEERKKSIEQTIEFMSEQLAEIAMILNGDKEVEGI